MEFFNDVSGDSLKPTLFELVAQEQLRDLLQPALKYVLSVFAQRYPRYLLRLVNRHEEFYAVLMLFVERYYLKTRNASFAENFYGLKRRRRPIYAMERTTAAVGVVPAQASLRSKEITRSLIFLVGLPYLRSKAQDFFEELGGGADPDMASAGSDRLVLAATEQTWKSGLRRWYKVLYPWLDTIFEMWLLVCNVAYVFERTPYYRPWLSWVGVDIRRLGIEDMQAARNTLQQRPNEGPKAFRAALAHVLLSSPQLILDSLKVLLPTAIFFVKFLEWWYSPSSPARALSGSPLGPAVPPPRLLPPHPQGIHLDAVEYGACPLCHGPISNATAMPSGYVFCYRCAYDHAQKHGKCPVTLLPCRVWQLRKILV